nr:Calx-beta domain-containing protein [Verrucomicrobiota bacterium JB025]
MTFRLSLVAIFIGTLPSHADWREEIGFTRLASFAASELPTATTAGLAQIEALEDDNYAPDTTLSQFADQTISLQSGSSGTSSHASHVGRNFYGSDSQLAGAAQVDVYYASDWISTDFLNLGTTSLPLTETRAVQNHSWIGTDNSTADAEEINQRLDYAINRDGFVCLVGMNNGSSATYPQILGQAYHTIAVGRDDGNHSAGLTTLDGTGRSKPEIVAPSASPESATSWTTPMVAGTAGLLVEALTSTYGLTGADKPRVTKAILLASATKDTLASWSNSSTTPLDTTYGAGELNAWHAWHTLRAGRVSASTTTSHPPRGWAAESVPANSSKTYFLSIPAGASTPFSACLTWHRAISSQSSGNGPFRSLDFSATLADLNLRLYQADGLSTTTTVVEQSLSSVDNVELVHDSGLPPGDYALVVENASSTATSYALAWHSLPAVTIEATVATAAELDLSAATLAVSRTGETTLPLLVSLSYSGTATAGADYESPPAELTIPAGASSATVEITPISDDLAQGDRTITVTAGTDFSYVSDSSAGITIADKPFDAWRFLHFTSADLSDPAISGESADPDSDQLANLLEYALGTDPNSSTASPVAADLSTGSLAISLAKSTAATDISWDAQVSADLLSWSPAEILTNSDSLIEARAPDPLDPSSPAFIRVKITRP